MLKKSKLSLISLFFLVLITLASLTAPFWINNSPLDMEVSNRLLPPSNDYWFGSDEYGRDIFSRVVYATRISLFIGFSVAIFSTVLGVISGLLAGYYKKIDAILMRVLDGVISVPALLLALALVATLGGSMTNIVIALTIAFWPVMTRVVRSATLQVRNIQYVEAAKVSGVNDFKVLTKYVLPNVMAPIIVQGTFIFAKAILAEAALSFLGVGIQPPTPTWGNMLGESRIYMISAPWFAIFPGLAIMFTVLSLNMLGDGLRDALDPRNFKKEKSKKKLRIQSQEGAPISK